MSSNAVEQQFERGIRQPAQPTQKLSDSCLPKHSPEPVFGSACFSKRSSKPYFDSTLRISAKTLDFTETPIPSAQQTPVPDHEGATAVVDKTALNSSQNASSLLQHSRSKPPVGSTSRDIISPRKQQARTTRNDLIKRTAAKVAKKVAQLKVTPLSCVEPAKPSGANGHSLPLIPKLALESSSAAQGEQPQHSAISSFRQE